MPYCPNVQADNRSKDLGKSSGKIPKSFRPIKNDSFYIYIYISLLLVWLDQIWFRCLIWPDWITRGVSDKGPSRRLGPQTDKGETVLCCYVCCTALNTLPCPSLLRELLKKKMQLNYGLLPKRSYPPSPPRLSELLGHFFVGWFFFLEILGHFLCRISPKSG